MELYVYEYMKCSYLKNRCRVTSILDMGLYVNENMIIYDNLQCSR